MSRNNNSAMDIPPTARAIALLIASTPAVQDAQIGVLQQLLEFSHRYTSQVLSDALVYADHAGRSNKIEAEDVSLAVQARVGWEFGGRVPKDFITSLATQTNAQPLPSVPETFGLRLPPSPDCLTSVDFDLHPNRPPPAIKQYDEEIEEIEESGSEDDDEDMEPAQIPSHPHPQSQGYGYGQGQGMGMGMGQAPPQMQRQDSGIMMNPVSAVHTPSDVDMIGVEDVLGGGRNAGAVGLGISGVQAIPQEAEEGSDEEDGLFGGEGGDDEESGGEEGLEEVPTPAPGGAPTPNGVKRKLVEDDDYD